jgi:glutamate synthase (NADPH/NADH) small chain
MGKPTGFLEFTRELPTKRKVEERVNDHKEFINRYTDEKLNQQSGRCMNCGVPFCHNGCPLGNVIPEFNDAVYRKEWKEAYEILASTNNFPEFTENLPCALRNCMCAWYQSASYHYEEMKNIISNSIWQSLFS